jgi:AcrR family transcriptional regulator
MSRAPRQPAAPPRAKPLKRPRQARARFTVQAIYDAFVRIWQRDGWSRLTTRAVALETGISVGTLYDYFPSKQALLSGYVRHAMEALLARLAEPGEALTWPAQLTRLVRLTAGADNQGLPIVDREMLLLEAHIAEPKHHRRFYEELVEAWRGGLAQCDDLPQPLDDEVLRTLAVAAWGGRRYLLLVEPSDLTLEQWAGQLEALCRAALGASGPDRSGNVSAD